MSGSISFIYCQPGTQELHELHQELSELAEYLSGRHDAILLAWRTAIKRDPEVTSGDSLPRSELVDHIPEMLLTFERSVRHWSGILRVEHAAQESAAAHGLQRWQQGYDLREVARELGKLNECVVSELDAYAQTRQTMSQEAMAAARQMWASLCSTSIEESVNQFFELQQYEAAGQVKDLERALEEIRELEKQRGGLWQQAAHDLRGNLGVVANVAAGLSRQGRRDSSSDDFVRILMRNTASLSHLLNDVTSLARLQAGQETRRVESVEVASVVRDLCEGFRALAEERGLYLRYEGPEEFTVDGDAVKIRRIAQNLVLNAVKYTHKGGITVNWGDSDAADAKRWLLFIQDSGPGFHTDSGRPLAAALEPMSEPLTASKNTTAPMRPMGQLTSVPTSGRSPGNTASREAVGEGIGLSIVKRLCDMLDATIEMQSAPGVGTTFRILFPRQYSAPK